MANKRHDIYKAKPMTEGKKAVIQGLLNEYDIQSAEDIQDALKDLLSGTIQKNAVGNQMSTAFRTFVDVTLA